MGERERAPTWWSLLLIIMFEVLYVCYCVCVQVFSQMIHVGVDLQFSHVESVLAAAVLELERNKEKIANPGPKDDVVQISVSTA